MADYYPLLARAVTGLQNSTPEARQAIYDRARNALLGQLRGITPALPVQDIERESDALDAAVNRLEDELAAEAARRERADKSRPDRAPVQRRPRRDGPVRPSQTAGTEADRQTGRDGEDAVARGADRRRIEPMHPAAPTPQIPRQSKARIWIVGVTIVAVIAMIGLTAYFLREDPQELVHAKPGDAAPTPASAFGKITGRAGGKAAATNPVPSKPVAVVPIEVPKPGQPQGSRPPGDQAGNPPPSGGPATPARPEPATPQAGAPALPGTGAPPTSPAPPSTSQPAVPMTDRAALLIQKAPGDGKGPRIEPDVKEGKVTWRLDTVTGDPGQPLQTALRADIDIPEAHLKVSMQMQKNTDPALTASHTIVLGFTPGPGSSIKGIASIEMPQMRKEDEGVGESLLGIGIVPITPLYYLVGLQQGEANIKRNFELLTTRNWFDVRFVLDDGRVAKITFEKGAQGQTAMKNAIAAWQ